VDFVPAETVCRSVAPPWAPQRITPGPYPALDRAIASAWLDAAAESWRFLFVVFPGVDGISHLKDPFHPAVLESYRLVDRALGAFVARVSKEGTSRHSSSYPTTG